MVDKQPTKKQIQERKPELDVMSEKEYVHQVEIHCSESKKYLKDDLNPRIRKLNDTRRTFLLPKKSKGYLYFLPKLVDGKIKLVTSTEVYEELQGKFKNKRGDGTIIDNEFLVNLSDNKQLYITGSYDSKTAIENGDICLSINSVGTLDGKKVYGDNEPEKMKELLDLSNARPIEINYKVIVNDDAQNNSLTESRPVGQVAGANKLC